MKNSRLSEKACDGGLVDVHERTVNDKLSIGEKASMSLKKDFLAGSAGGAAPAIGGIGDFRNTLAEQFIKGIPTNYRRHGPPPQSSAPLPVSPQMRQAILDRTATLNRGKHVARPISDIALATFGRIVGRTIARGADGEPILTDKEIHELDRYFIVTAPIMENDRLPDDRKTEALENMLTTWARINVRVTGANIAMLTDQAAQHAKAALAQWNCEQWIAGDLILQSAKTSALHKLDEAMRANLVSVHRNTSRDYVNALSKGLGIGSASQPQLFLVQHNWAGAFANAKDFDGGEVKLPHADCFFEFVISGNRVVAMIGEHEIGKILCMPFVQDAETKIWAITCTYAYESGRMTLDTTVGVSDGQKRYFESFQPLADLIGSQIRAISIALEAEVAVKEIVRVPHKMNHARERRGKLPMMDYHVVSLAHRCRTQPLPPEPGAEPHHRVRMHFRRGHWRHFENHKTWIKWMLVGDPDLGFVDKHYKL